MTYKALQGLIVLILVTYIYSVVSTEHIANAAVRAELSTGLRVHVSTSSTIVVGASLSASPSLVDVGSQVTFTLSAEQFTPRSTVAVHFLSPHHGYAGPMPWDVRCGCFRLGVYLASRIHPLETARVTAIITAGKATATAYGVFEIRGLTPNGKEFAAGGTPILTTWVGDPTPVATEFQHYCVWARTSDALGIPGLRVRLSVHFQQHVENWIAGTTGPSGVLCVRRSIGHPVISVPVHVFAYAGSLQAQTQFTPHA